jgi:hypothetical protein
MSRNPEQHAWMREILAKLKPGQAAFIPLPGGQPHNRIDYQRANGIAYALWGAGQYRLKAVRGGVSVERRPGRLAVARGSQQAVVPPDPSLSAAGVP